MTLPKLFHALMDWVLRDFPGGLGQRLRYAYWRKRLGRCGRNVRIEEGVIFHNPANIEIGDNVWIFAHSVLTAPFSDPAAKRSGGKNEPPRKLLTIGDEVQVGLFSILNGTGGLEIGNCVTLSARVTIYSATHLPRDPDNPGQRVGANGMVKSRPVFSREEPVVIGAGAWLGLGVNLICASVGENAFVKAGATVTRDVAPNCEVGADKRTRARFAEPME